MPLSHGEAEPAITVFVPEGNSADSVRSAVLAALRYREWTVTSRSADTIVATLDHHGLSSTLTIKYDARLVTIQPSTIGFAGQATSTPSAWLHFLRADIRRLLAS